MKKINILLALVAFAIFSFGTVNAGEIGGYVVCDTNQNDSIDLGTDLRLEGVVVNVSNTSGWTASQATWGDVCSTWNCQGFYLILVPTADTYTVTLDETTLPPGSVIIEPASGEYVEEMDPQGIWNIRRSWLIDCVGEPYCGDEEINQPNETCEPPGSEIIPGIICRDDCTYCGDGILDAGEDCDDGNNTDGDGCSAVCTNEPGGEGCTPGYWRNHFEDWPPTGYSPADDFDTTFGVNLFLFEKTLGQAVWLGGGGIRKLARHGTAALLSAAHPDVAYPYSVAEVIAFVQGGDADPLVAANELGCEIP